MPQFRQIVCSEEYELNGKGIIEKLASWQHPAIGNDKDRELFDKTQSLLRKLLYLPNVELEVPPSHDHIIVANDGLRLPLESYGTGVHELIILAIAVFSADKAIFCIEEPEIHLHPRLQKEFLQFLVNETNNRYVISTHSNALLVPSEEVQVVHLWLEAGATRSRCVESSEHGLQILDDLGVRASDLLQANSVIWVEGPSDRIYIKRWLELCASELREGIDYSIMFYGGRCLSHLTADREEIPNPEDLIPLLRINQHSMIVMDSDRKSQTNRINATKRRIRNECSNSRIPCWITSGREIENYLAFESISKGYKEITGSAVKIATFGKYESLEEVLKRALGKWKNTWSYNNHKPERARIIAKYINKEHMSAELLKQVNELCEYIPKAT